jgi:hypothetical protein
MRRSFDTPVRSPQFLIRDRSASVTGCLEKIGGNGGTAIRSASPASVPGDLSLRMVELRDHRYVDTSVQIDLQLRSTTRANVTAREVKVDLDIKTYDYLRTPGIFCPRVLVVLVMPAEEGDWLSQSQDELAIRHCAYWLSLAGHPATAGTRTVRVAIPLANIFSVGAVRTILQHVRERKEP